MVRWRYKKIILSIIAIAITIAGYVGIKYHDFFIYHVNRFFDENIITIEDILLQKLEQDPTLVFETFKQILQKEPQASAVCHGIAHKLGHHAYELYGFNQAMQYQNSLCGAGYIHGVIESHFGLFSGDLLSEEIKRICESTDEQCNHGVGHGLMIYTHNNIEESLQHCDGIARPGRSDCYDGVFMHVFDNEETGISKDIPERQLAEKLCAQMQPQHMTSCYFYLPRIFTHDAQVGEKTAHMCNSIQNISLPKASEICAYGAGISFEKYGTSHDAAVSWCDTYFTSSTLQECRKGIAAYASWSESRFTE